MKFLIAVGLAAAAFSASAQVYFSAPRYEPRPYYAPPPVYFVPPPVYVPAPPPNYYRQAPRSEYYFDHRGHQHRHGYGARDDDRDGVPNRFDSRPHDPRRY